MPQVDSGMLSRANLHFEFAVLFFEMPPAMNLLVPEEFDEERPPSISGYKGRLGLDDVVVDRSERISRLGD